MHLFEALNTALAGRYQIEHELGRGGMASVWLAQDLRHDRAVAIKVLHPELAGAIGIERFLREVRVTAGLQHPNIIPVLDSGTLPGPHGSVLPWYAMAYIDGESLRQRLQRERHIPVDDAVRITREAAGALQAAHREHIVHRDIKPENLMLSGGHVYISDFGIARALMDTGGERLTSTGLSIGTPAYMSPEQATASEVDARTDQYSLACVLYEMLAGEPPFTGPTPQALVARRLTEPARPIRTIRSAVPPGVEAAVLKALERVPADRFGDTAAFAEALSRPATGEPGPSGRKLMRMAAALVAAVAIAGFAWFVTHDRGSAQVSRDPAVIAFYERGLRGYQRRTPEGATEAIQAFTAAVERDSNYSSAWAALARAYVRAYERYFVVPGVPRDRLPRLAVRAVDRAIAGDPRNPDVLMARAVVSRIVDPTDVGPSLRDARQALELDSTLVWAWHFLAVALAESGKMEEALGAWRSAVTRNPSFLEGLGFMGQAHYWRGQHDSAAVWADSAIALDPTSLLGRQIAGHTAVAKGDYARGFAHFEAARRVVTDVEVVNTTAGMALARAQAGRTTEARELLRQAETLSADYSPIPHHTALYLAQAHVALKDFSAAIAWLRRYEPRESLHFQLHLRCDPPFAPIANDERFQALLLPLPGCADGIQR
jgi:tetratricopeptide (TPR) repeat protein